MKLFELFMDNNLFIPEKSSNNWYIYNFSFIEHEENNYTRIYYLAYKNSLFFYCLNCWEKYEQCDDCSNYGAYALIDEKNKLIIKGYLYDNQKINLKNTILRVIFTI